MILPLFVLRSDYVTVSVGYTTANYANYGALFPAFDILPHLVRTSSAADK